ncbi:MAG TPA: LamG domain-containing protein, partial [Bacteroidales bacterium]|nr:LamG domain-containing protein [Bacteroidales bacterium]
VVNTLYTDSLEDLGFRVATGIVSGNISFEGGNPVQGAEVFAEPENEMESYSIELGSGEYMISDDSLKDISSLNSSDISVEFYVYFNQFSPSDSLKIFNLSNTFHYFVKDGYPGIVFNGSLINSTYKDYFIQSDSLVQDNVWNQVTITLSKKGVISLYNNGTEIIHDTINPVGGFGRAEDRIIFGDPKFFGKIDEVRIWNRVKSNSEIKNDYKRKLSGKENGLVLYWKLYEGIFDRFYDISKTGTEFNKHNGRLLNATTANHWSTYVPPFLKLHPAGISDKYGNYVIEGFPYQGNGNIFSVIPVLGVHEFAPVKTNLFVGDNSPVHNNVNFKDMSAFNVSGNVKYLGENFPVEGVEILLDGDNMYDVENNIMTTDADGNFSVKVPIGQHVLSIRKDGHVFVQASYPPKANGKTVLKDFQDDISGLQFLDSTKRIIAGRVVGGIKEGDKKIGFGLSVNNIGSYTLTLEAEKGYNYTRTVTTDSVTGEYKLVVLPEKYIVKDISGNPDYLFDLTGEGPLDLSNISERTKVTDTVWSADGNTVDTVYGYEYDLLKNWIYRSPISIHVTKPNGNPVICDSVLDIQGREVPVYSVDGNGNVSYLFGQPVFANRELDSLKITVNEEYINYQNQNKYISPVQDATLLVNNSLAVDESPKQFTVDENGVAFYSFVKGNPNMSA